MCKCLVWYSLSERRLDKFKIKQIKRERNKRHLTLPVTFFLASTIIKINLEESRNLDSKKDFLRHEFTSEQ